MVMFLGIFGLYLDCNIIWFGICVLRHGCKVFKVLGIVKLLGITCHGSYDAKVLGIWVIKYGFESNDSKL